MLENFQYLMKFRRTKKSVPVFWTTLYYQQEIDYIHTKTLSYDRFAQSVRLVNVISCAKFYRDPLRGLDFVWGQILTTPIGMRCYRLHGWS